MANFRRILGGRFDQVAAASPVLTILTPPPVLLVTTTPPSLSPSSFSSSLVSSALFLFLCSIPAGRRDLSTLSDIISLFRGRVSQERVREGGREGGWEVCPMKSDRDSDWLEMGGARICKSLLLNKNVLMSKRV